MRALASLLLCVALAWPVGAVQPDEMLTDPALEARARALSAGLRCLVCRNESIDESDATLARDLRLLVRERLMAGDSDTAAVAFIVDRYGEFVLLKPVASGSSLLLWISGPVMLLFALGIAFSYVRRRQSSEPRADLSPEDQHRLDRLLEE